MQVTFGFDTDRISLDVVTFKGSGLPAVLLSVYVYSKKNGDLFVSPMPTFGGTRHAKASH